MAMYNITVKYGVENLQFSIPKKNLVGEVNLTDVEPIKNLEKSLIYSFYNPIESLSLDNIVRKDDDVAIIVDDHTRNVPSKKILSVLCSELEREGISKNNISIIIATGMHRAPTREELIRIVGVSNLDRYQVVIHNADSPDVVYLGRTSYGNKVYLDAHVANRKKVIVVSDTNIHYFAGYGGGRKSILPGICARSTITQNHRMMFNDNCRLSNIVNNSIDKEMNEVVDMLGVHFSVQVVLNAEGKISGIYSGDIKEAFMQSILQVDKIAKYSTPPYDVLVLDVGGYPYDSELHQSFKAVTTNINAVREGGIIFLVAKCPNGIGYKTLYELEKSMSSRISSYQLKLELLKGFSIGAHKSYFLRSALERNKIYLITDLDNSYLTEVYGIDTIAPNNIEWINKISALKMGSEYKCLVVHNAAQMIHRGIV